MWTHHVDGVVETFGADVLADGGTSLLQQHQRLQTLGRTVGHDPATVAGAEGETALQRRHRNSVSVNYDNKSRRVFYKVTN